MFSLTRRRREAERNKKLEDVFREADTSGNGRITPEQMIRAFEVNDCGGSNLEEEVNKLKDKDGLIKMGDFIKYALTTDLMKVEFHDRVFHRCDPEEELNKKQQGASGRKESKGKAKTQGSLKQNAPREAMKLDRVELAFRKFDLNKDGYLSRDEFDQMMKNVDKEQADRIFRACDTSGDNRISLDEFRKMVERGKE